VILVTELTRWGCSARFAARSLTCLKFRFVSSPLMHGDWHDGSLWQPVIERLEQLGHAA
jgi:hypothetical protein